MYLCKNGIKRYKTTFRLAIVVYILSTVHCEFSDEYSEPDRFHREPLFLIKKHLMRNALRNFTSDDKQEKFNPSWAVPKVSKKQTDLSSILLGKTKIVETTGNTNFIMGGKRFGKRSDPKIKANCLTSTTSEPDLIDDDYLYEDPDDKPTVTFRLDTSLATDVDIKSNFERAPAFAFHINDPVYKRKKSPPSSELKKQSTPYYNRNNEKGGILLEACGRAHLYKFTSGSINPLMDPLMDELMDINFNTIKSDKYKYDVSTEQSVQYEVNNAKRSNDGIKNYDNINIITKSQHNDKTTTVYDKIRFFELYDQQTGIPVKYTEYVTENVSGIMGLKLDDIENDFVKTIDSGTAKHAVKEKRAQNRQRFNSHETSSFSSREPKLTTSRGFSSLFKFYNRSIKTTQFQKPILYSNSSKKALWREYPFMAVYVYEPAQVHCDAAAISPHWLVASGSCLSRHQSDPSLEEGQSAFVAYCGGDWWNPERVAYVKNSLLHPSFQQNDDDRRHHYNIGVIRVVNSLMSSCVDWAPVQLMSHQFNAAPHGSKAYSVGWALDRYGSRYASAEIPKSPLMVYESLIFSGNCPGSIEFRKLDSNANNVYCLLLPPYSGETGDPVHGAILLVEGKLVALYLQEKRRSWGEQSAVYTGVWRLIPWIMDVAKEPDVSEMIDFEI